MQTSFPLLIFYLIFKNARSVHDSSRHSELNKIIIELRKKYFYTKPKIIVSIMH